jgi:two-component system, cell cycle sensor histidine kinase and response regulator CckA
MNRPELTENKFKWLLIQSTAVPLILMGVLASIMLYQVTRLVSITRWVAHSDLTIAQARNTEKLLVDMQTGLRGYLLNQSPVFLEPYRSASLQIDSALDRLKLLAESDIQQRRVDMVRSIYQDWAGYSREVMEMRGRGEDVKATNLNVRGEQLMDQMRTHLEFFVKTEEQVLSERGDQAQREIRITIGAVLTLAVALGALLALLSKRQIFAVSDSYKSALLSAHNQAEALRKHEQALMESEERYRRLVESTPQAILVHRLDKWLFANQAAARLIGLSKPEELIGESIFGIIHQDYQFAVQGRVHAVMNGKQAPLLEVKLVRPDKSIVNAEIVGIPFNYGGQPAGLLVVTDITGRRRLEEQLVQSRKMEAIGRLAGGIAHDFNNLLTAIIGYSQLLLRRASDDDHIRADIGEIENAAQRAAALTSQLMVFGRGQMVRPRAIDLKRVVGDLDVMLRRLIGEDIELITILDPQSTGIVKADTGQIDQVLMNLVLNARDAMPSGGKLIIEIHDVMLGEDASLRRMGVEPGPYVALEVSDTGCGMDQPTLSKIFEPFFTTKDVGKGTGLGLSTVYGIVKQSAGDISVYSELGKGTTFKVYLPRHSGDAALAPFVQHLQSLVPGGQETVLLVEDEPAVQSLAARTLREGGYRVLQASNGAEAIRIAEEHSGEEIHLLLTDVVMPQVSGKETSSLFKASRPNSKVLFVSGYTNDAIIHHGVLDPGIAFLQKPFTPDSLLNKVRTVLDESPDAN